MLRFLKRRLQDYLKEDTAELLHISVEIIMDKMSPLKAIYLRSM